MKFLFCISVYYLASRYIKDKISRCLALAERNWVQFHFCWGLINLFCSPQLIGWSACSPYFHNTRLNSLGGCGLASLLEGLRITCKRYIRYFFHSALKHSKKRYVHSLHDSMTMHDTPPLVEEQSFSSKNRQSGGDTRSSDSTTAATEALFKATAI